MMIKNIIFDFGGVIVDLSRDNAVKEFQRIGVGNAEEILDVYHQNGIFLELEEGKINPDEFCRKLCDLAGKEIPYEEIRKGWLAFLTGVPAYRLEFLEELRKEYKLYILSNTNPFVMSWALSNEFTPAGKPLDAYFDKLYLSYEIKAVKPDKEIFEFMIKDGINPEESLFVDDGQANVKMGHNMGFQTLLVVNGEDWREELKTLCK